MSSTIISYTAQPTNSQSPQNGMSTPPLLPAFLITGLLLGAIVFIIVWRHIIERRALEREEEDPTWPSDGHGGRINAPTPKLWELQFSRHDAHKTWGEIMPLSATPLRGQSKPRLPRYLVPSDRPVTFFQRMFGGDRREPPPQPPLPPLPPISVLTETGPPQFLSPEDDEDDDAINRLQVSVLIALPHPHASRRSSDLPEKTDTSLQTVAECSDTEGPERPAAPDKGKKPSLEMPTKHSYYHEDEDEEGPMEVAFGTAVLPFAGGAFGKAT